MGYRWYWALEDWRMETGILEGSVVRRIFVCDTLSSLSRKVPERSVATCNERAFGVYSIPLITSCNRISVILQLFVIYYPWSRRRMASPVNWILSRGPWQWRQHEKRRIHLSFWKLATLLNSLRGECVQVIWLRTAGICCSRDYFLPFYSHL